VSDVPAGEGIVVTSDAGVLRIVIDRPERKGSVDPAAVRQMVEALEAAATDDTLRVVLLTGTGSDFCSGADWVASNADGGPKPRPGSIQRRTALQAHRLIALLLEIQLPVVCAVRGWAAGLGCQLALAADLTVAAEDSRFWLPFTTRGFTPDSGATWLVPRLVGVARAKEMLLLGRPVTGRDAAAWGMIHRAVPADSLDAAADELVAELRTSATVAVGLTKRCIHTALDGGIVDAMADEALMLEMSSRTADFREGLRAFTERPGSKDAEEGQMEFETILYEVEDRTATITFNRPEQLNAVNPTMVRELRQAYAAAEADGAVWTILVTGNGRAFCAGADVTEIPEDGRVIYDEPYLSTYPQWEAPQEATPPFRSMTKPILTAVNGLCCGAGLDLVTTGDITIASDRAEFFDPHVSIGLVSGREVVRLARVLPLNIAMRVALTGRHERMSAQRAYELGMVSEVVEHERLLARAQEVVALVNRNAPLAVRGTRLAIRKGLDLPLPEAEILAEAFRERVLRTEDAKEGPRAFVEKRPPDWQAR